MKGNSLAIELVTAHLLADDDALRLSVEQVVAENLRDEVIGALIALVGQLVGKIADTSGTTPTAVWRDVCARYALEP